MISAFYHFISKELEFNNVIIRISYISNLYNTWILDINLLNQAHAWFLETVFVQKVSMRGWVCVCVCVCVRARMYVRPQAIKNHSHDIKPEITNQTSPTAFQFLHIKLAINITDGHGLSNKAHRELLSKKSKGNAVFAVHFAVKGIDI